MDNRKKGSVVYKAVAACLVGTAMLLGSPQHSFGQAKTWTTSGNNASVDVFTGAPMNLVPSSPALNVGDNDSFAFDNAGHILTFTDGGAEGTITSLGDIITVSGGGGTLVFDLRNPNTELKVGRIGGSVTRRITMVEIWNSGKSLTFDDSVFAETLNNEGTLTVNGNVFAGTLNNSGELEADTIDAGTLNNSGTLEATGVIDVTGTLTNSGVGELSAAAITAGTLTNSGTLEATGTIDVTGTLTNNGDLTALSTIDAGTLNNSGTLEATGTIDVTGTLTNNGDLTALSTIDAGTLNNSGTLDATGAIDVTGTLTNNGDLTALSTIDAGTLNNNGVGTLLTTTGTINVDGTLTNDGGAMLTAGGAITAGTLNNNGVGTLLTTTGAINVTGALTNSGMLNATGAITADTLANSGTLNANNAVNAINVTGALTNSGQLNAAGAIDVGTLINNGGLTTGGGTIGTLGGSNDITSNGNLTIGNTVPDGFSGILTVNGNAAFNGNGRADLGTVKITGNTIIGNGISNTVVAIYAPDSEFRRGAGANNRLENNATLEFYGELTQPQKVGFVPIPFTGDGKFVSDTIFTAYRWDGSEIYVDPNGAANMSDGYLAAFTIHHRYTAWNMVRDRLMTGSGSHGRGYRGQSAACHFCDPLAPCECHGKSLWFNGTGRYNTYSSSFNNRDWKTKTGGGQIGFDLVKIPRFQTGLLFGYEESQSKNTDDQLKARDFYVGVYGAYLFRNGADARIVFAQGWQSYGLDRIGKDGLLYKSSFNGGTSEANFELGKRIGRGGWGWSLRPVLAADVFNNNLEAAQESGGAEAVRYGKTNLTQVFIRTGTDLRHRTPDYTFNSGIYYAHDVNGEELRTHVWNAAIPDFNAPLVSSKWGKSLLMFNLGIEGEIFPNFSAFGGYQGEYAMDSANGALHSVGYVGFFGKW